MSLEHALRWLDEFQQIVAHPRRVQRGVWGQVRSLLERSPYWRQRMGRIPKLSHFPLTDFVTDYRHVAEAHHADPTATHSPFNGEPMVFWVETSGTMDRVKVHPWTSTPLHNAVRALGTTNALRNRHYPGVGAYTFRLVASLRTPSAAGHQSAPLSGALAHLDWRLSPAPPHPPELLAMPADYARWRPAHAMAKPTEAFGTSVPSTLVLLLERIEADRDFYRDALLGRVPGPFGPVPTDKAHRDRVLSALADPAPLRLDTVFPRLRFVSAWTSGTAGLQVPPLRRVLGDADILDAPLVTSEAVYTVNRPDPTDQGGTLAIRSAVFEFLEAGAARHPDNLLQPWELDEGRLYETVVTSALGYVRYLQGDLVRCTGFDGATPRIVYVGRADHEVSVGNLTLSEVQVTRAATDLDGPWLLAPVGAHFAAFVPDGHPFDVAALDAGLRRENHHYEQNRADGSTPPLELRRLRADHPVWRDVRAGQDQRKPRVLFATPPA